MIAAGARQSAEEVRKKCGISLYSLSLLPMTWPAPVRKPNPPGARQSPCPGDACMADAALAILARRLREPFR